MPVWLDAIPEKAPKVVRPGTGRWLLFLAFVMLVGIALTLWCWTSERTGFVFWFTALGLPFCTWGLIFGLRRFAYKAEQVGAESRNVEREALIDSEILRGQRCAWILGTHINAGVMGNMTALAGEKLGLFARTGQLSLKSGEGPVEVQAQNASLRLFAEKKLTLSSASDISFAGKKRITLIGGGSYLRLEAGKVEYGTTATYIRKVKRTMFAGANSTPTPSISMPLVDDLIRNGFFDEQFRILDDSGKPMANVPYFISSENGETFKGVTDNQGLCKRVFSKESAKLTVWLGVLALERW